MGQHMLDLKNQTFGLLTALYPTSERRGSQVIWYCGCACGNHVHVPATALVRWKYSCGCARRPSAYFQQVAERGRQRAAAVVQQIRAGKTQTEIATERGLSRQRIEQLVRLHERYTGEKVECPLPRRSLTDVARELGVSIPTASVYYRRLKGFHERQPRAFYNVTDDDLMTLKRLFAEAHACPRCGQDYLPGNYACPSAACRQERQRHYQKQRQAQAPTTENTERFPRTVLLALQKHAANGTVDEYIGHAEACRVASISSMQLTYLRQRGIITSKPTTRVHWLSGKPICLYSRRQMEIIRKVVENG